MELVSMGGMGCLWRLQPARFSTAWPLNWDGGVTSQPALKSSARIYKKTSDSGILVLLTGAYRAGLDIGVHLPAVTSGADPRAPERFQSHQTFLDAFLFVFAAAQLAYGPLSDRFGRKPAPFLLRAVHLCCSAAWLVSFPRPRHS